MIDYGCMESSTIAQIIRTFNIAAVAVLACFAVYGLVVALAKKRSAKFLSAFCVAALLAFAAELVVFNYKHYLKWFAGEEVSLTVLPSGEVSLSDTSVSVDATGVVGDDKDSGNVTVNAIVIKNLNRKVTSVYIHPIFNNSETMDVSVSWMDEALVRIPDRYYLGRTLYKALPHGDHIAIHAYGNVSEFGISAGEGNLLGGEGSQIAINRQIPYYFSGLRLFVVSLLFFAVISLVCKPLRAKAAYYLFEYKFDPANGKQNIVYACLVVLSLIFLWFCDYTSVDPRGGANTPIGRLYNAYLVDAFIAGRTNIDYSQPEKLLGAERPYNRHWLGLNGYADVEVEGDVSYYKGKFYFYYGVVPAVLIYLPYKLLTGNYLSHHAGVFVFAALGVVFLALLWRFLVKKYMPDARFAFVALSFLALFFVSHLFSNVRCPGGNIVVVAAAFAFVTAGTFLLLTSVDKEKISLPRLFFACLCFALAVGCRPNAVLASLLVPAVLWKRGSWKLAAFALIPYVMVALPLCVYNYARFDSILEFGHRYCIGSSDPMADKSLNPFAKIHRAFVTLYFYFFRLYHYSPHFPFVELVGPYGLLSYGYGFMCAFNQGGGLINFPILFCLLWLFKNIFRKDKPSGFYISSVFLVVAVVMTLLYAKMGIFHARYLLDCAFLYTLSSLFCAYYWCGGGGGAAMSAVRQKVVYALLAASIFVGMFLFAVGPDQFYLEHIRDPALYRYLEYSLGIVKAIS